MSDSYKPTPDDLLAAIAFQAQRIVSAAAQTASGAAFVDPAALQSAIEHMLHLNGRLLELAKADATASAASSMSVELH